MGVKNRLKNILKKGGKNNDPKRFEPLKMDFRGNTLYVHDIASFKLGQKELFEKEPYLFESEKPNPLIIDCGANLGMSVIYFKELYPEAEIIAFEADPYIFSFLEKNISSFRFTKVEIINKALWDREETLFFYDEGGAGGRIEERKDGKKYKKLETISLAPYLEDKEVDFLKIDIEGAEFKVLENCRHLLKNVQHLFIEYHSFPGEEQKLHKILDWVQQAGFRYHIKEAFTRQKPFVSRKTNVGMDLQLNIFCYRRDIN
ncbi:FkbM family methyltransferase [Christiangramia sabulilitoris]|uniref:FkbM family methyltransferase n=1 Tax=Christiangramia sabulilitoris TaxID=2583991 RepID=A0A550HYW6_9FLAO|nr:FkbM family methyltransferase [Christiangramia sabulilitoris]TRO63929.1 FkbM family methyltransferase [Christiangramia sabulilitoris]